jgi:hypothetical protein
MFNVTKDTLNINGDIECPHCEYDGTVSEGDFRVISTEEDDRADEEFKVKYYGFKE